MNTAIIMLGSNTDTDKNLELAKEKLTEYFEIVTQSSLLITEPFGKQYASNFHNIAVKLLSDETAEETKAIFKSIEKEMGRTLDSKKTGVIPIDIDLIYWNDDLKHEDYQRFVFVKNCVDQLR